VNRTAVISTVVLLLCGGAMLAAWLLPPGESSPGAQDSPPRPPQPVAHRPAAPAPPRPATAAAAAAVPQAPDRPQDLWRDHPTASPFEAVRWHAEAPQVLVGGRWYDLVSLDGIPAAQILSFCRALDERDWRKRFEQDLYEVLCRMEHEPGQRVKLVVREPGAAAGATRTLENVPMTAENRRAIWWARRK
jgi:hypothetical protein